MEKGYIPLTEEMFAASEGRPVAQGEVYIWMKKYAPDSVLASIQRIDSGFRELKLEDGKLIVGHSETGHHHVIEPVSRTTPISKAAQALIDEAQELWATLLLAEPCDLVHQKGFNTHKTYRFPAGEYIIKTREEQVPDGWRKSAD